jgi:hypothetical protein
MPTQDNRQGLLGGMFSGMRDRFRRERQGARNAIPGQPGHSWAQTADALSSPFIPGNLYASQNAEGDRWFWERAGNNVRDFLGNRGQPDAPLPGDPSMPMPNYGQPGQGAPVGMGPLPNYGPDQTHAGPPAPLAAYGNGQGMFPMQQGTPGRQGQAGRFGTTIAQGPAAVAMARGFAPTGLGSRGGGGASSYGRDQMMRRTRQA